MTIAHGFARLVGHDVDFTVTKLAVTLGRSSQCDMVIPLPTASLHHATVAFDCARRQFMLHVHGRNGISVNGKSYERGSVVPIWHDSILSIGPLVLYFVLPSPQDSARECGKSFPGVNPRLTTTSSR